MTEETEETCPECGHPLEVIAEFVDPPDDAEPEDFDEWIASRMEFEEYLVSQGANPREVEKSLDAIQIQTTNFYPIAVVNHE